MKTSNLSKANNDFIYKYNRVAFIKSMAEITKQRKTDGFDNQRIAMSKTLGNFVQYKLHQMQNPKDCSTARLFVCENSYIEDTSIPVCGWGCLVLQLMTCFRAAFATNRVLVANATFFR